MRVRVRGGRLRAHELRRRELLEEQLVLLRVRAGVGVGGWG